MVGRTIYCHFSFRRPKGKDYGIFAVAFYKDSAGQKFMMHDVVKMPLWKNHQFITAIQSYSNALRVIAKYQGYMRAGNINSVYLVSDNSTLVGWIINPKKNKAYTAYMNKAVEPYRVGSTNEIELNVGICEAREYEKSYKYCKEENVAKTEKINTENKEATVKKDSESGRNVLDISINNVGNYKTILDLEEANENKPDIVGME